MLFFELIGVLLEVGQLTPGIGAVVRQEDWPLLGQSASGVGGGSVLAVTDAVSASPDFRAVISCLRYPITALPLLTITPTDIMQSPEKMSDAEEPASGVSGEEYHLKPKITSNIAAAELIQNTTSARFALSMLLFEFIGVLLEVGQLTPGIGAVVRQEDRPLLGQSASSADREYSDAVSACVEDGSVTVMCLEPYVAGG